MKSKTKFALNIVGIILASLVLLYMVVAFIVSKVLLDDMFGRAEYDYELSTDYTDGEIEKLFGIKRTAVEFDSNGNTLRGNLWGDTDKNKLVVIAHGIGSNANGYYNEMLYFVKDGYRILTYDCTGSYTSEGKGTTGLSQSHIDLHNALLFVERNAELKDLPVYLFGHSWGGHAVTAVLNYGHKNIKAVASVAGYSSNGGIMLEWMKGSMGMGGFSYLVFPFAAICSYAEAGDAYNYTGVGGINKVDVPVLALQGGKDEVVFVDSIYSHRNEITNEKFEYIFYENATHNGILSPDDDEILKYHEKIINEYKPIREKYNDNIPREIDVEFFKTIDKTQFNGVNNETMTAIKQFFDKA